MQNYAYQQGWQSLGRNLAVSPAVGRNQDGRLELFLQTYDGSVEHIWQNTPGGGWSGQFPLGNMSMNNGRIVAGQNQDGRLELFVRGNDNALWHLYQTAPNNGWSNWESLGGTFLSDPALGLLHDGRMELFLIGTDHGVYHS